MKFFSIKIKFIVLIGSCTLLSSCVKNGQFEHNEINREYLFYSPNTSSRGLPLVVVLHGFTSSAHKIMNYSKMNEIAKKHNFAVLYPQGTMDKDQNTFWNVGYSFHEDVEIDDIDYIAKLTRYIQKKHKLSVTNTFLTGMSNGGEMCYLMICEHPKLFKASAPVAGMMLTSFFADCDNSNPNSIFAIFGTNDDITNFEGDLENKDGWGAYQSIPYTINYWAKSINYNSIKRDTLPDVNKSDGSFVIRDQYINTKSKNEVLFYNVINGGHDWPGSSGNMDINTSQEIWTFFNKHKIVGASD